MPSIKRLIFFGTPEFAVPTLAALQEASFVPVLVVSQPTRRAGRGRKPKDPPVVAWAREHELEVEQTESVKSEEFLVKVATLKPDLAVVVAFGQIFPQALLDIPKLGAINLHASLLPKYRGAAPIAAALVAGEKKTGVTTMQMEAGLDSGPILLQEETEIYDYESAGDLAERLAGLGAELMVETLHQLQKGSLKPRKQRDDAATYAPRLSSGDGKINWALSAEEIANRIRAYTPWPGAHALLKATKVKILWAVPMAWETAPFGRAGTVLGVRQGRLAVLCGDNTILGIDSLQRPGKRSLRATEFVNGERLRVGDRFA